MFAAGGFDLDAAAIGEADLGEEAAGFEAAGGFYAAVDEARAAGGGGDGDVQPLGVGGEAVGEVPGEFVEGEAQNIFSRTIGEAMKLKANSKVFGSRVMIRDYGE